MSRSVAYLEAAADRVMIQDMLGRYAWEVDHGTPEGFAAVFSKDGVFEIPLTKLRIQGTHDLTAFARDLQRTLPNIHHVMSNFVIDLSGDRGQGRCELNEFLARPEAIYPSLQGWYEDEYVFDGEQWRIQHRRVCVSVPESAVAGKLAEHTSEFFQACAKYQRA